MTCQARETDDEQAATGPRPEIVRCLTEPGTTVTRAAESLGIGRATLYRKIAHYGITLPG